MTTHRSSLSNPFRWLSVASTVALVGIVVAGCGGDKGTDINVDPPATNAGTSNSNTGGSNSSAGTSSNGGSSADAGAPEGGAPESGSNGGGTGGTSSGGTAGTTHGGSSNGGTAGSSNGGTAGMNAGGKASGGSGGSAGTGGGGSANGGTAGSASGGGGTGGGGTGGGGANQTCGNGTIEGTEQCDDMGPSKLCSDDCRTVETQDCVDCEAAGDCFASSNNCLGPTATPFTKDQIAVCYDVFLCMKDEGCLKGAGTPGKCYCGTLSTADCGAAPYDLSQPGAPNGPCAALMQKGQPTVTTNSAMLGALTNKARPAGAAGQRLNCDKMECADTCGLQ